MLTRTESRIKLEPAVIPAMAGFISAAVEITAMWPAEYAKTLQQLNRNNPAFSAVGHIRENGLLAMYQGLAPLLIGAPVQGLIRFSSLEYFNNLLKDEYTGETSRASGLLAGVAAGLMESVIIVTPMETVKTVLVDSKQNLVRGVKTAWKKEGIRGMYKGLVPTAAKSASNQALRFAVYNEYKRFITRNRANKATLSKKESLLGGMLAGFLGALGNTPFDTIKSRMQGLESGRYTGMWNCGKRMVMEEGPLSLYKGLLYRCSRVVPGQGIMFFVYEWSSKEMREFYIPNTRHRPYSIQRQMSLGSE